MKSMNSNGKRKTAVDSQLCGPAGPKTLTWEAPDPGEFGSLSLRTIFEGCAVLRVSPDRPWLQTEHSFTDELICHSGDMFTSCWQPTLGGDWYWFELLCKYTAASLFATNFPRLWQWPFFPVIFIFNKEQASWTLWPQTFSSRASNMTNPVDGCLSVPSYRSVSFTFSFFAFHATFQVFVTLCWYSFQRYLSNSKDLGPTFKVRSGFLANMGLLQSATTTKKALTEVNMNPITHPGAELGEGKFK